jgi:hypothetical protein
MGEKNASMNDVLLTCVIMLCGTAIVLYGMHCGLVDQEHIFWIILLLFGGEQLLKAAIKERIDANGEGSIPAALLFWYRRTAI